MVQLSYLYMTTGKIIAFTTQTSVGKVLFLLFTMLSRFVIAFLLRSKHLLIWWLQWFWSPRKVCHCFHFFSIYLLWSDRPRCHDLSFSECWALSQLSLSSFTFIKRLFSSSSLSAIRVVSSVCLRLLIFLPAILIPACASSSLAFLRCILHRS